MNISSPTHAIFTVTLGRKYGVHACRLPERHRRFARDVGTSQQVWSAEIGYPGSYREFYRDIGWGPLDYIRDTWTNTPTASTSA